MIRPLVNLFSSSRTLLLGVAFVLIVVVGGNTSAGAVDHPSLVPTVPESGYPIILDTPTYAGCGGGCTRYRETFAVDLIDGYIVSGGNFLNVELQDASVISRRNLAVFDVASKQLVCPTLDVNNEVLAITAGPEPKTAIIAGRFTRVTGADGVERVRTRMAKVNLETCQVDRNWIVGNVNSKVTELAVTGDRLFAGGDFTIMGGLAIERLAEIDFQTGTVDPSFSFVWGGEQTSTIAGLGASPDGSRLGVVHRATTIAGNSMRGTAIFNISNPAAPTLTPHRMATTANAYSYYYDIQDGAIAPDFSFIGIVQGTATVSDYTTSIPTTEAAGQFSWQKWMRDSSFGIEITNNAIYVAGHFCKIDDGPGPTDVMAPNSGPATCTGTNFPGGAFRTQIAALAFDGTPLTWNPGNDAARGGTALKAVDRGLLVGFDGDRTNFIRTGTTAFFDFGPPPDPRTDQTCTAVLNPDFTVTLDWTLVPGGVAGENYAVRRNNSWVANVQNGITYTDDPPNGTFTYRIRTVLDGVQWDTDCTPDMVVDAPPPQQSCTATLEADNSVTVDWTEIPGENSYGVRRNGNWLTNVTGGILTYNDPDPGAGTWTYSVRSKKDGITTLSTCTPDITVDPPQQTCTATLEADRSVTVVWTEITGEGSYGVRRNGNWLTNVTGGILTYNDPDPGVGTWTYSVRSTRNGVTTLTVCTPDITIDPIQQTCTATTEPDGSVTLVWTEIPGEGSYGVRRNNSWITNVTGGILTYNDQDAMPGDTYEIRSTMGGVTTTTPCL